jgi:glycosyltransferase involved in cell wall biosynthesis
MGVCDSDASEGSAVRIVATIPVYNEADMLDQVLNHLYQNGVSFVVLDGGSQDGSIEIALSYRGRGLLEHKLVPRERRRLELDLDCLLEMASRYYPDWILSNDADEFLEAPNRRETLHDAISKEHRLGFNLIQFDNFEFCLTEKDCNSKETDVRKKLRFYSWSDDHRYKAWKYYAGTSHCVHFPRFSNGVRTKVSPRKFVMRHYRFRSPEQALHRVFKDRVPRFAPEERAKGWHYQYDHFTEEERSFIIDSKRLSRYNEDGKWDLTKRFDWYPNWTYPSCEELFGPELYWWEKALFALHRRRIAELVRELIGQTRGVLSTR